MSCLRPVTHFLVDHLPMRLIIAGAGIGGASRSIDVKAGDSRFLHPGPTSSASRLHRGQIRLRVVLAGSRTWLHAGQRPQTWGLRLMAKRLGRLAWVAWARLAATAPSDPDG